jgi:hypothetical protein
MNVKLHDRVIHEKYGSGRVAEIPSGEMVGGLIFVEFDNHNAHGRGRWVYPHNLRPEQPALTSNERAVLSQTLIARSRELEHLKAMKMATEDERAAFTAEQRTIADIRIKLLP